VLKFVDKKTCFLPNIGRVQKSARYCMETLLHAYIYLTLVFAWRFVSSFAIGCFIFNSLQLKLQPIRWNYTKVHVIFDNPRPFACVSDVLIANAVQILLLSLIFVIGGISKAGVHLWGRFNWMALGFDKGSFSKRTFSQQLILRVARHLRLFDKSLTTDHCAA